MQPAQTMVGQPAVRLLGMLRRSTLGARVAATVAATALPTLVAVRGASVEGFRAGEMVRAVRGAVGMNEVLLLRIRNTGLNIRWGLHSTAKGPYFDIVFA